MRDQAEAVIRRLSRASTAYPLYEAIRASAIKNIERALAKAEEFDDE